MWRHGPFFGFTVISNGWWHRSLAVAGRATGIAAAHEDVGTGCRARVVEVARVLRWGEGVASDTDCPCRSGHSSTGRNRKNGNRKSYSYVRATVILYPAGIRATGNLTNCAKTQPPAQAPPTSRKLEYALHLITFPTWVGGGGGCVQPTTPFPQVPDPSSCDPPRLRFVASTSSALPRLCPGVPCASSNREFVIK